MIIGGFNWLAAAVSANRERPNLGFESKNAWWWWEDRYLGIEINDMRFKFESERERESLCVWFFFFFFLEGYNWIRNEKVRV